METPDEIMEISKKVSRRARKRMLTSKGIAMAEKKLKMMDNDIKKEVFERLRITGERVRSVGSVVTHEKFELCQESNVVKGPNCDNQPPVEVVDLCDSETSCEGHSFGDAKISPPSSAPGQADGSDDSGHDEDDDDDFDDDDFDDDDFDDDDFDDEDDNEEEDDDDDDDENDEDDEDDEADEDGKDDDDKLSNSTTDDVVMDLNDVDRTQPDCMVLATYKRPVINAGEKVSGELAKMKTDNEEIQFLGAFPKQNNYKRKQAKEVALPVKNRMIMNENLKNFFRKGFPLNGIEKPKDLPLVPFKRVSLQLEERTGRVGGNVYVDAPIALPSSGLRPIIIDGSNVAFVHSNCNFSCKRLEICINYFKEKGHKVTAFVPQFRLKNHRSDNPQLLRKLEQKGDVVLTPSKRVDGLNIVPYDDRFIVQTAVLKGGVIVTRDNYNDLLRENPAWAETIKYRTLAFTWVDHDILIFPKDPLGEFGPSLEEFLRFN